MKTITINGIEYCKYQIDNDIIFLNCGKYSKEEAVLICIIQMVEQKLFKGAAYLNLEA